MLVLARRSSQSIMVGDLIEIKIIEVKGEQVKIGIEAPKDIVVHRKEIYEEIKEANILASQNYKLNDIQQIKALGQQLKDKNSNL